MGVKSGIDVTAVLMSMGVDVLKETRDEVIGHCPMHMARTGSPDHKPSWSMNRVTLLHFCFSCGYKGSLRTLAEDLGEEFDESLLDIANLEALAKAPKAIKVDKEKEETRFISEYSLTKFVRVPRAVRDLKNLTAEGLATYGVCWDRDRRCWIIPIRTPKGVLLGWQERYAGSHPLNWPKEMEKNQALFGFAEHDDDLMVLVESPLDVVRIYDATGRRMAVASFGGHVSDAQVRLLASHGQVVMALDNDAAGLMGRESCVNRLLSARRAEWLPLVSAFRYRRGYGKDPGDCTDAQIQRGIADRILLTKEPPRVRR